MQKLLIAISMVLVLLGGPAWAGSSRGASFQGYSSGPLTGATPLVVDTRGAVIYNITLNATSATSLMVIYDSPVYPFTSNVQETPIYEIEVVSAGNTSSIDMNAAPLQTYYGVVVSVTNGTGFLNMEK